MSEARASGTTREDEAFAAYVECALWASYDDEGNPYDELGYTADDFAPEALAQMRAELVDFLSHHHGANAEAVAAVEPRMLGHDFWLTRNRHGAGFWDRGLGPVGDALTEWAHSFGESDVYVGDDGRLYVAP